MFKRRELVYRKRWWKRRGEIYVVLWYWSGGYSNFDNYAPEVHVENHFGNHITFDPDSLKIYNPNIHKQFYLCKL